MVGGMGRLGMEWLSAGRTILLIKLAVIPPSYASFARNKPNFICFIKENTCNGRNAYLYNCLKKSLRMKWAYYVKYKVKAAIVLFIILLTIILNNFSNNYNYSKLDDSFSSLYKDRLLPATYLFQLSGHLYGKQLLHQENTLRNDPRQVAHDQAMAAIIKDYEGTYLTQTEKNQWQVFKSHLQQYHQMEQQHAVPPVQLQAKLEQTISSLSQLTDTQVVEAGQLRKTSSSILSSSISSSHLELSLLIVLGLVAMVLLSVTDRRVFKTIPQKTSLN